MDNPLPIQVWFVVLSGCKPRSVIRHLQPSYARQRPTDTLLQRQRWQANAALVHLTSSVLGLKADGMLWRRTPSGAPMAPVPGKHVSLSHVRGLAAIALAEVPVGIDVECPQRGLNVDELAAMTFTASEQQRFQMLEAAVRESAFFTAWTRKEAVLKGLGVGLAAGLHRIGFNEGGRLVEMPGELGNPSSWTTRVLQAPGAAIATIAARAADIRLTTTTVSFDTLVADTLSDADHEDACPPKCTQATVCHSVFDGDPHQSGAKPV